MHKEIYIFFTTNCRLEVHNDFDYNNKLQTLDNIQSILPWLIFGL
jgi:hypothetical protein